MSEVNAKMREDIKSLEKEIKERENYFYDEVKPKLMRIVNMVTIRSAFTHYTVVYQQGRLKIIFSRFRRSGVRRRRKDIIRKIEIRYKYRTVLLFEYNDTTNKDNLIVFHSCDWLTHIDTLCESIPQMIQEEDYKDELKRLKKRQKKLKTKCENFKVSCNE